MMNDERQTNKLLVPLIYHFAFIIHHLSELSLTLGLRSRAFGDERACFAAFAAQFDERHDGQIERERDERGG